MKDVWTDDLPRDKWACTSCEREQWYATLRCPLCEAEMKKMRKRPIPRRNAEPKQATYEVSS